MLSADVVVAGGGVAGLLIASALSQQFSVTLIEQNEEIPRNKYWLTDGQAGADDLNLASCIDRKYGVLDFVAYDGLTASVAGSYSLWNTDKLIDLLTNRFQQNGGRLFTGRQFYSLSYAKNSINVRASGDAFSAKLFIDCMGFGSPLVGAKNVSTITGYYILHGCELPVIEGLRPIALDNVMVNRNPAFFELFPTSRMTAHAAIIFPTRHYKADRSIQKEFAFILKKSHYSKAIRDADSVGERGYFGIVPVGRLHSPALERIVFFGEAGQANPAASATGLTRMLRTYRELASRLGRCIEEDRFDQKALIQAVPAYMSPMNRAFQESLFESLLSFDSDRFRQLIHELKDYPSAMVNDLLFAEFDFRGSNTLRFALDAISRPESVLGKNVLKSLRRYVFGRRLR